MSPSRVANGYVSDEFLIASSPRQGDFCILSVYIHMLGDNHDDFILYHLHQFRGEGLAVMHQDQLQTLLGDFLAGWLSL